MTFFVILGVVLLVAALGVLYFYSGNASEDLTKVNPQGSPFMNLFRTARDRSNTKLIRTRTELVDVHENLLESDARHVAERMLIENKQIVIQRANQLQVPYEHFHVHSLQILTAELEAKQYLLRQQIELETHKLKSANDLEIARLQKEQTIKYVLSKASLEFEEQEKILDQLRKLRERKAALQKSNLDPEIKDPEIQFLVDQIKIKERQLDEAGRRAVPNSDD